MIPSPVLSFTFDIRQYEDEMTMKGYCQNVTVKLPDSSKYNVSFYDPVRLMQDLKDEKYIAEPGLIIIMQLTLKDMEMAVNELWRDGYFEKLKPIKE